MKLYSILFLIFFFPSYIFSKCIVPELDRSFLKPYETEEYKWKISSTHFYENKDLGYSIEFNTKDEKITYYSYSLGLTNINNEIIEEHLLDTVLNIINTYQNEKETLVSKPLLLSNKIFSKFENKIIEKAVYFLVKKAQVNTLEIISLGGIGKCFHKLRSTAIIHNIENIEQYFENPASKPEILASLLGFQGFIKVLDKEFNKANYYNRLQNNSK